VKKWAIGKKIFWGAAASLLSTTVAGAQSATDDDVNAPLGFEEIIVQAQKRSQSVQDVPVSITALSEKFLEERNIDEFSDFARLVPSLSFQDQGGGQGQIAIRGIASAPVAGDEPANQESVGIYFGEVPVAMSRFNPDLGLFDVSSVSVLRGPQGTLYGAGSLAGTIKIEPNQPNADSFEGAVQTQMSGTKNGGLNYRANSMINAPIVDGKLALRAVLSTRFDDGFVDNVARNIDDIDDERTTTGRVIGKFTPNDQFSVTGTYLFQSTDTDGFPSNDLLVGGNDIGLDSLEQSRGAEEGITDDFGLYNLVLEYAFDNFNVVSSSSYIDRDLDFDIDLSSGLEILLDTDDLLYAVQDKTKLKDFVQEVRFTSINDSSFQWLVGGFYTNQDRFYENTLIALGGAAGPDVTTDEFGGPLFIAQQNINEKQVAVFGEFSYQLTDRLKAIIGGRWFDVTQDFTIASDGIFNGGQTSNEAVAKEDGFNPKFLLSYAVNDDILINAQAAQGFRLGGPNDPIPFSPCEAELTAIGLTEGPQSFDSESLWNYELNAKTSWLDRRLVANAAVFYIDYEDIQATRRLNCGFGFTDNAGSARSVGVEMELFAKLAERIDISFGGSYVDAKLNSDETLIGSNGDRLPLHPRLSLNGSFRYTFNIFDDWEAYGAFDYSYTGEIISVLDYDTDPTLPQPLDAYHIGGLRFGLKRDEFEVALFVDNVWDERAELFERSFFGDLQRFKFRNQPRTVGVSARTHF